MERVLKVLVVDDEPQVRDILRKTLESAGHEVSEATDGIEAIQRYRQTRPDCVISDILMPKKGGIHFIREIRELSPEIKILAISGGGTSGKLNFLATAKTFPGVRTLKKPFRMSELLQTLDEMCGSPSRDTAI